MEADAGAGGGADGVCGDRRRPRRPTKAPKTAYGQPDLQGIWTNATITPLTRDPKFGTRNVLTKAEADGAGTGDPRPGRQRADAPTPPEATVTDLKNADCGPTASPASTAATTRAGRIPGTDVIDMDGEKRASIIDLARQRPVPGPDGRRPATRRPASAARRSRTDNPEGRSLGERCILLVRLQRRPADAAAALQQQLPDRADQGRGRHRGRDGPRRPPHPPERQAPCRRSMQALDGRLDRPLGGRHPGRRDHQHAARAGPARRQRRT